VDALGDVLDGVRARSASFCRVELRPPWSLRIADESPLALATTVRGEAWVVLDGEPPVRMRPGAVAVVKGPEQYTIADHPDTPEQVIVGPGNSLRTPVGRPLALSELSGEGADPKDVTVLASGTYQVSGDVGHRLLDALPRMLVIDGALLTDAGPADVTAPSPPHEQRPTWHGSALGMLAAEIATDEPAQQVVLDRLLDVALIETLRAWFALPDANPPGWYAARADPVVRSALDLLHTDPAGDWTLEGLARAVGVSRATLARRFRALVGEPPMTYLANWRVTQAADLLRGTGLSVDAVARQVGYANGFALSVAFMRLRGVRPSAHRTAGRGRVLAHDSGIPREIHG
jgi:AraC-like DNA-binding protein